MVQLFVTIYIIKYCKINCSQQANNDNIEQNSNNNQSSHIDLTGSIVQSLNHIQQSSNNQDIVDKNDDLSRKPHDNQVQITDNNNDKNPQKNQLNKRSRKLESKQQPLEYQSEEELIDTCTKENKLHKRFKQLECEEKYLQDQPIEQSGEQSEQPTQQIQQAIDEVNEHVDSIMKKKCSERLCEEYMNRISGSEGHNQGIDKNIKLSMLIDAVIRNIEDVFYAKFLDENLYGEEGDGLVEEEIEQLRIEELNQIEKEDLTEEDDQWLEQHILPIYRKTLSEILDLPFQAYEKNALINTLKNIAEVYEKGSNSFVIQKIMKSSSTEEVVENGKMNLAVQIHCRMMRDRLTLETSNHDKYYIWKNHIINKILNKKLINHFLKNPDSLAYRKNAQKSLSDYIKYFSEEKDDGLWEGEQDMLQHLVFVIDKQSDSSIDKIHKTFTEEEKEKFSEFKWVDTELANKIYDVLCEESDEMAKSRENEKQEEIKRQNSISAEVVEQYINEVANPDNEMELFDNLNELMGNTNQKAEDEIETIIFSIDKIINKNINILPQLPIRTMDDIEDLLKFNNINNYEEDFIELVNELEDIAKYKSEHTKIKDLNNRGQYEAAYGLILLAHFTNFVENYRSIKENIENKINQDPQNLHKFCTEYLQQVQKFISKLKNGISMFKKIAQDKKRKLKEMKEQGYSQQEINEFNEKFKTITPSEPFFIFQMAKQYLLTCSKYEQFTENCEQHRIYMGI